MHEATRTFVYQGRSGKPFTPTTSLLQGCPLATVATNLVVATQLRLLEAHRHENEHPLLPPLPLYHAFLDDRGLTTEDLPSLNTYLTELDAFDQATAQKLNTDKTTWWSTTEQGRRTPKRRANTASLPSRLLGRLLQTYEPADALQHTVHRSHPAHGQYYHDHT